MRHYWILGLFGVSLYFTAEFARGGLWFQDRHVVEVIHAEGHSEAQAASNVFVWSGALDEGQVIEIFGINGSVSAEPADGGEVEVLARKSSRRSDINSVRIELLEHAGGVTVCTLYPSRRASTCRPGDAELHSQSNDVKVEFTIRVPQGVQFRGRTVNGGISATGLSAAVQAETVNGSVEIATLGPANASTVNGSILASIGSAVTAGDLSFKTVNGEIELRMPVGISADFSGGTLNGSIATDFPLSVEGRRGPKRLSGALGDGGGTIHLETVNGAIRLLERNP